MSSVVLALAIGLAVGLSLGLVGGGGSVLAVPLLVYALGEEVGEATTTSLLVVSAIAAVGAADHSRAGRVRGRVALVLAVAGAAGSLAGTALNRRVDGDAILVVLAVVLIAAAAGMAFGRPAATGSWSTRARWAGVVAAGLGIGALTGFLGVGGGFLVVPTLVLLLGLEMPAAVGTSLLVIAIVSAFAFGSHLATGPVDWAVAAPLAAGGAAGAVAGSRLGARLGGRRLELAFAGLLAAVAVLVLAETAAGLV